MDDVKYTKRTIEGHTLYSAHLGEDRNLKIYLPTGYDPAQRYPILYCHDGNEFFTHGRIATIANRLIAEGTLQPILIAGIAVSLKHRSAEYASFGARNESYSRFVVEECIPYVESRYAVTGAASQRFMAGISLGAVASFQIHRKNPTLFSRMILLSGAYFELSSWKEEPFPPTHDLSLYMVVGEQEDAVETAHGTFDILGMNRNMRQWLASHGVTVDYREEVGKHIWGFWQKQLPDALIWLNHS